MKVFTTHQWRFVLNHCSRCFAVHKNVGHVHDWHNFCFSAKNSVESFSHVEREETSQESTHEKNVFAAENENFHGFIAVVEGRLCKSREGEKRNGRRETSETETRWVSLLFGIPYNSTQLPVVERPWKKERRVQQHKESSLLVALACFMILNFHSPFPLVPCQKQSPCGPCRVRCGEEQNWLERE